MKIEHYSPSGSLKPYIKTFMIIESEHGVENRLLPDTSVALAFRLSGDMTYTAEGNTYNLPSAVITGLRKSPRMVRYSAQTSNLIVLFKEGGAAAFFKEPIHELFGKSISLDELIPRNKLNQIEEQLNEANNNYKRIQKAEDFFLSLLRNQKEDKLVDHAIQKINMANGNISIKNLANILSLSQDPFEKRFRRMVGISPKKFSSIVRLKNLIKNYSPTENLTSIAHTAGYFDQAHFIKDFESFTGQPPLQFFKTSSWW